MVEHFFLTTKLGIYSCHLIKVVAFNCCGVFYLCKMKTLSTMRPMETDQKTFHWMGRLYDATLSWWNVVQSSCQEMKYRRWPRIGLPILSYAWSILLLFPEIRALTWYSKSRLLWITRNPTCIPHKCLKLNKLCPRKIIFR